MEADCEVTIILLGESDVGKTSLILRFFENKFKDSPSRTTINKYEKVIEIEGNLVKLILWDTAGRKMYHSFVKNYYSVADGVLLIYDIQDLKTFSELSNWLKDFKAVNENAKILIVGNKSEDESSRSVNAEEVENFVRSEKLDCIEVSSKYNKNVDILFHHIVKKVLVAKGILPYSKKSQPVEFEKSQDYISSTSISSISQKVDNTSNNVNSSDNTSSLVNCSESLKQNITSTTNVNDNCNELGEQSISSEVNILNSEMPLDNYEESFEQNTYNTNNTSATKNFKSCSEEPITHNVFKTVDTTSGTKSLTKGGELSKQNTSSNTEATNSTELFTKGLESSENNTLSAVPTPFTVESLVGSLEVDEQNSAAEVVITCEKSIEEHSNIFEYTSKDITNGIPKENESVQIQDDEGPSLADLGFILISEDDLKGISIENAEQFVQKGRRNRSFFRSRKNMTD